MMNTVYVQIFEGCDFHRLPNSIFIFVNLLLSHLVLQVYYNCFEDLNFVGGKLHAKTVKFMSLECLYVYGSLLAVHS